VRCLFRDDRDGLDGGGAGPDDADAAAGEVHALVWPVARVIPRALEAREPLEVGDLRGGQAAGGHDAEARRHLVATIRAHRPPARPVVEDGRRHARGQLDVATQVEAVGDVIGVPQQLRL
jgi:hypothetical protein